MGQPVFKIPASDKGEITKVDESKDFHNCEKNLYLSQGARIVINTNLNAEKGIFNSATGTIHGIICDDDKFKYLIIDLDESKLEKNECFQGVHHRIVLQPHQFKP